MPRPDIEVFLGELAKSRTPTWKRLAAMSADDESDPQGRQDPAWMEALAAAQDAWEVDELAARTQDVQDLMEVVSGLAARAGRWGLASAESLRRAAAALGVRPWIDHELFVRAYGGVDRVIPISTLGTVSEARRRVGPPHPRTRIEVSATTTTRLQRRKD
jgi:hypothetical protein